jgi:hypothetical protein
MVTSRASNDTLPPLLVVQVSHLVIGATKLKAENREKILSLKKHSAFKTVAQVDGMV